MDRKNLQTLITEMVQVTLSEALYSSKPAPAKMFVPYLDAMDKILPQVSFSFDNGSANKMEFSSAKQLADYIKSNYTANDMLQWWWTDHPTPPREHMSQFYRDLHALEAGMQQFDVDSLRVFADSQPDTTLKFTVRLSSPEASTSREKMANAIGPRPGSNYTGD